MRPTYEELLYIVEQLQREGKDKDKRVEQLQREGKDKDKRIDRLEKQVEKLTNELRKYLNENTPSGSIPPYLKKLEDVVNRYAGIDDDDKEPPKENIRNARPRHIERKEHHSLKNPTCPDPSCGGHARRRGTSTRKRIVIELQLPKAETVEHESDVYQCEKCGKVFSATVPNALPKTEFDITTTVFISYLSTAAKMSVYDVKALLHLFGIDVSEGSITNAMKRLKTYLGPYYKELLVKVKSASARYKDETSHRFNGKTFWTWVVATTEWVYYAIEERRSHKVAKKLASDHGSDIVDGYAGYNGLSDIQRDWSHSLRRAKKPIYDFGEDESYEEYKSFIKRLSVLFYEAKIAKKERGVSKVLRNEYNGRLWKLLQSAPTKGKNFTRLTNYIMKFDGEWFTFLEYEDVDPTNNLAERMLRPMVIKRRISQQSRGADNMDSYAMQMSMYMSTRLQGADYIETLSNVLKSGIPSVPYKS